MPIKWSKYLKFLWFNKFNLFNLYWNILTLSLEYCDGATLLDDGYGILSLTTVNFQFIDLNALTRLLSYLIAHGIDSKSISYSICMESSNISLEYCDRATSISGWFTVIWVNLAKKIERDVRCRYCRGKTNSRKSYLPRQNLILRQNCISG